MRVVLIPGKTIHPFHLFYMNNYTVRSYKDVIVITKIATRRASKAQNIVMY